MNAAIAGYVATPQPRNQSHEGKTFFPLKRCTKTTTVHLKPWVLDKLEDSGGMEMESYAVSQTE